MAPPSCASASSQQLHEVVAVEDVVAQHQRARRIADELVADDEGLRQAIGAGLHRVLQVDAPLAAVAQQLLEARRVLRRADDQDVAHAAEHQRAQRVVDHRLVVHRQQLLADGQRGRVQPGAGAAGEDDAFALGHACLRDRDQSVSRSMRATPACQCGSVEAEGRLAACRCSAGNCAGARAGVGKALVGTGSTAAGARLQLDARLPAPARARSAHSRARWSRRRPPGGRARPWPGSRSVSRMAWAVTSASSSAPVGAPNWSSITVSRSRSLRQAQHGLGEVAAARRIDPAGAKDQVPRAVPRHQLLAFELGARRRR